MKKQEATLLNYKQGLKEGLPIGLGYLSVSFAFGVLASSIGIPIILSALVSMTNLTSAGQKAGIDVLALASGGAFLSLIIQMIVCQLVINSRYFLMGIALSQKLDKSFSTKKRFFFATFITDEIFAVAVSKKSVNTKYLLGLATLPYFGWATGTILGAVLGNLLPVILTQSLGLALYAMFIAIIIPPSLKSLGVSLCVLLGTLFSCLLFFFTHINDGFKIVISTLTSSCIVAFLLPVKEEEQDDC